MNLLLFFIALNVVNVILQTVKTLLTTRGNKWTAAIGNAIAYGVYTVLLVYMNCDLALLEKVFVVGGCNLLGVFIVKYAEERMQKDKLWKIELTVNSTSGMDMATALHHANISHNWQTIGKWTVFNCFCQTKEESRAVKVIANHYHAKSFASESKVL